MCHFTLPYIYLRVLYGIDQLGTVLHVSSVMSVDLRVQVPYTTAVDQSRVPSLFRLSVGSALADEVTRAPPSRRRPAALEVLVPAAEGGVVAVVMVRGRGGGRVSERGRDYGGLDGDDPGVHHLTVHLHHHFIAALRRVVHRIYTGQVLNIWRLMGRVHTQQKV